MGTSDNFYLKRRSVLARMMSNEDIPKKDLETILAAGIRVPDHGALNPWKIKVCNFAQTITGLLHMEIIIYD